MDFHFRARKRVFSNERSNWFATGIPVWLYFSSNGRMPPSLLLLLLLVLNITAAIWRRLFQFLFLTLRFYRPDHAGPVVSVMRDLWQRVRAAHGIPLRGSHVWPLYCCVPSKFSEKSPSLQRFRSSLSMMQSCTVAMNVYRKVYSSLQHFFIWLPWIFSSIFERVIWGRSNAKKFFHSYVKNIVGLVGKCLF